MSSENRIIKCIYIDMSNLYGGMSELFSPGVYLDFSTLMSILDEVFDGIDSYKIYGAYMGSDDSMPLYKRDFIRAQNEFLNSARKNGVYFGQGKISNHGQEKGVDMMLGVDMVNDAHLGLYTDYILFSGDADFTYPIDMIKGLGKNFHYCSFANRFALSFAYKAWRKVVIDFDGHFTANIAPTMKMPRKLMVKEINNVPGIQKKFKN
jgi:uncharacterized LabA/DUF88 family protein